MRNEKELEQFEKLLESFMERTITLEDRLRAENKLIKVTEELHISSEKGDSEVFQPGRYLGNLELNELMTIDHLIREWEHYASLGMEKYKSVMGEHAGEMEYIYNFLKLSYKPILEYEPESQRIIGIGYSKEKEDEKKGMDRLNKQFYEIFKKEIGEIEDTLEKEENKEAGEKTSQSRLEKLYKLRDKINEKIESKREEENSIKNIFEELEMELLEKEAKEIEEAKKSLLQDFTDEKAAQLYRLLGLNRRRKKNAREEYKESKEEKEFWQVVKKGIKNRDEMNRRERLEDKFTK